jgi:serine/threonine protein kinase
MHVTPDGFTLLPKTERAVGEASRVFDVLRNSDGTRLVCKRLGSRALDESWLRERLGSEGALLSLLDGRGAPRLVASGQDGEGPWLIMERIGWPALATRAGRRDAAWLGRAAEATLDVLAGIHAAGIVHADLSPDNVMVSDDGAEAVLVDFGLSLGPGMPPMPPGPFRGTLVYAAPEVARGEPFGPPADRFALAASLLHVWSNTPPRSPAVEPAMLLAAGETSIVPWAERAAEGLAPGIARRLVRCCAFDANDRLP